MNERMEKNKEWKRKKTKDMISAAQVRRLHLQPGEQDGERAARKRGGEGVQCPTQSHAGDHHHCRHH